MIKQLNPLDSEELFFQQASFAAPEQRVFHGFFSRRGGVSKGIYAALNCAPGSGDSPKNIAKNREIVAEISGCAAQNFLGLYQCHSSECVTVQKPWPLDRRPKGDAMVTDVPGVALGILTADCAPVLFHGQKADGVPVIGAAHAGWGGALKGVLENTVQAIIDLGASLQTIRAVIGPCIAQVSYEVKEDFALPFYEQDEDSEKFFKAASRVGHLVFDLAGYCAFRLAKTGVQNVSIMDMDTYLHEEAFFSYRRTTHRNEKDYGRQVSVVIINDIE